jgi:hypothetical protein
MALFLVRVELHATLDYSHPSYEQLHTAMQTAGFTRTINPDAAWYKLQSGSYRIDGDYTLEHVTELAKKTVDTVDTNNSVLAGIVKRLLFSGPQQA